MPEESLEEFINVLTKLTIHQRGVVVRETTGELRSLTMTEMVQLGIKPNKGLKNFPELAGCEVNFAGSRFKIRF